MKLWIFITAYLLVVNLWGFIQMGIDKRKARLRHWRISEKMLFLPVLLGGGIGGTAGMYFFHHKTKHWYFRYGFPLITIVEAGIAAYIFL
jgi:uncharacterized membrane protein YsdA (DUF1294 family)